MKIHKLNNKSIAKIKSEIKNNFDDFNKNFLEKNKGFTKDELDLVEGSIEIPKIDLCPKPKSDFENSKKLYEALKLTPQEADDKRLWVYLSNCHFYEYTKNRWFKKGGSQDKFNDRLLYEGSGIITRVHNSISRLWWTAHLTIQDDKAGSEKWELTKTIFDIQDLQVSLLERNMGLYPLLLKTFIKFYKIKKNEIKISTSKMIQLLARDLNNYGGIYSLATLEEQELNEILNKIFNIHNSPNV